MKKIFVSIRFFFVRKYSSRFLRSNKAPKAAPKAPARPLRGKSTVAPVNETYLEPHSVHSAILPTLERVVETYLKNQEAHHLKQRKLIYDSFPLF